MFRFALLVLLSCPGCRKAPPAQPEAAGGARVFVVERAADLITGPVAEGMVGDWRLENDSIAAIVSAIGRQTGFSRSGGNVIDVAPRSGGGDEIRHVFLFLNETFPREAVYEKALAGKAGTTAKLLVRGRDSLAPSIHIETTYELDAGASHLRIRTRATNRGESPVADYRIGDVLQWGTTDSFASGVGFELPGRGTFPWLLGLGQRVSYGYTGPPGSRLPGFHGTSWSDVSVRAGDIGPGQALEAVRYLVVAPAGRSPVDSLMNLRKEPCGRVVGSAGTSVAKSALAGALVSFDGVDGTPMMRVRTREDGGFRTSLPAGEYRMRVDAPGLSGSPEVPLRVSVNEDTRADGVLGPGGKLGFAITDEKDGPLPVKIVIVGVPPTPDPVFGPRHSAEGSGNVFLSRDGRGSRPLAPGRYRAIATRGPEYDAVEAEVSVRPGETAWLKGTLRRVVDTRGFVSADLHQHAIPSGDSAVSLEDRVLSNLAAGLEVMVATDHDFITDYEPTIRKMGASRLIKSIPGNEVTTFRAGHFNVFPLIPERGKTRQGAFYAEGMDGAAILAKLRSLGDDKLVQVNHPRASLAGYFNAIGYDPASPRLPPGMDTRFDAIEILNGKRLVGLDADLRDWFSLLARGLRPTATGNSDTHGIHTEEAGYPRNFVALGYDEPARVTPSDLVAALRDRRDTQLSTGPFLRVSVAGNPIGSTVRARGRVEVRVEVRAAPWVDVSVIELWLDGEIAATRSVEPSVFPVRARATMAVNVERDAFLVAIARGRRPLIPYVSTDPEFDLPPIAVTNPIWIDADGNGRFDPLPTSARTPSSR